MGGVWLHDLPAVLASLGAATYPGWETRSRSSGGYEALLGVAIHHTASDTTPDGDMSYMWEGSPDGPVGAIYLARSGAVTIGAAGATNCVGKGGPYTFSRGTCPKDQGNAYTLSIEAASRGDGEAWPDAQQDAYVALVAALCAGYGLDPTRDVISHYGWCEPSCPGRKIDPAGPSRFGTVNASGTWDIATFRAAVAGTAPGPRPPGGEDMPAQVLKGDGSDTYWAWNGVTVTGIPSLEWVQWGYEAGLYANTDPVLYPQGFVDQLVQEQYG